jgi:hypothetical protein
MRRRTFLSTSAVAGLGAFAWGTERVQAKAGDIPKRTFGKTGEQLTIVGQAGGRFPLCTFEEAKAVTLRAYELGVNYFDTARIYWDGKSEEVYGAVLPPFRKNIFFDYEISATQPSRRRSGSGGVFARAEDRPCRSMADAPGEHDGRSRADLRAWRRHRGFRSS